MLSSFNDFIHGVQRETQKNTSSSSSYKNQTLSWIRVRVSGFIMFVGHQDQVSPVSQFPLYELNRLESGSDPNSLILLVFPLFYKQSIKNHTRAKWFHHHRSTEITARAGVVSKSVSLFEISCCNFDQPCRTTATTKLHVTRTITPPPKKVRSDKIELCLEPSLPEPGGWTWLDGEQANIYFVNRWKLNQKCYRPSWSELRMSNTRDRYCDWSTHPDKGQRFSS